MSAQDRDRPRRIGDSFGPASDEQGQAGFIAHEAGSSERLIAAVQDSNIGEFETRTSVSRPEHKAASPTEFETRTSAIWVAWKVASRVC